MLIDPLLSLSSHSNAVLRFYKSFSVVRRRTMIEQNDFCKYVADEKFIRFYRIYYNLSVFTSCTLSLHICKIHGCCSIYLALCLFETSLLRHLLMKSIAIELISGKSAYGNFSGSSLISPNVSNGTLPESS